MLVSLKLAANNIGMHATTSKSVPHNHVPQPHNKVNFKPTYNRVKNNWKAIKL